MAPTYMQIRTRIAVSVGSLKVSVVSSATPMVAVRPGSAPTMIPSSVAQATCNSESRVVRRTKASPSWARSMSLRQANQEELLERDADDSGDQDRLDQSRREAAQPPAGLARLLPLEDGDEGEEEQAGRERVG